jgi:GNAT superfamily N-acetyltransferase
VSSEFVFRDALPSDREEVLALTANTWEGGDYIHWVFDEWVADTSGRFLVAVDATLGSIAAIDKLSFYTPGEAWFEGLRVHPAYRGRGLAASLQTYMIGEARRLGGRVVRFLTAVNNSTVHRKAYRDGFRARFVVRQFKWSPIGDKSPGAVSVSDAWALRPATSAEATLLFDWWTRSSSWDATGGMVHRVWSFSQTTVDEWVERAARGDLLVPEGTDVTHLSAPPAMALVAEDHGPEAGATWTIGLVSAIGSEWPALASALARRAGAQGIRHMEGLLPDSASLLAAFIAAGFSCDPDGECLCLFELDL